MSKFIFLLLLLGILPISSVASSYSDYTDAIVYSLTTPYRETIEFLTEVWNYFVEILCYPFFKVLDLLKMTVDAVGNLFSSLIDAVVLIFELLLFRPITLLAICFYQLTDCIIRCPLTFATNITAKGAGLLLEKANIPVQNDKIVDIFAQILTIPIHTAVDLLQLIVFLVVQIPINVLFHGVIEYLIAGGLKLVVSGCQFFLCFSVEILRLPFAGIRYLLKGIVSLPLFSVLNILNFILFCIIDPVIYFIYLVINVTKICVLLFGIAVLTIYIYNYSVCGHHAALTVNGLRDAVFMVTRKVTKVAKKILDAEQTLIQMTDEDDKCCAVCFEERLLAKLIPCKHENTCMGCLYQIMRLDGRCPICRTPIQNFEF